MWKVCGYIIYKGEYPISALYAIWDKANNEINWTDDSNDATIFSDPNYGIKIVTENSTATPDKCSVRSVIMTDETYNK